MGGCAPYVMEQTSPPAYAPFTMYLAGLKLHQLLPLCNSEAKSTNPIVTAIVLQANSLETKGAVGTRVLHRYTVGTILPHRTHTRRNRTHGGYGYIPTRNLRSVPRNPQYTFYLW